ncbi:carboxypeptidase-like regulatory domain-containing protein [Bacteroidota bacterium]
MKRVLMWATAFMVFFPAFSQKNIILKGIVLDADDGQGVSFAHVGLVDKAVGTVTNEHGEFVLNLTPVHLNDTLGVSAIGYATYRFPVKNCVNLDYLSIQLQPVTTMLQEMVISDEKITGRRVLQKAIARISDNYPGKPFQLDGYYRDYMKKDGNYISFLEGAISVFDLGFRKSDNKSRIKINQLRYGEDYEENFDKYIEKDPYDTLKVLIEGESPFFNGNELNNMRSNDPIRNHGNSVSFIGVFDEFYNSNYDFEIAYYTFVNDDEVFVIHFEPKAKYGYLHVDAFGEIYIRVKDFAIIKLNYNYYVAKIDGKKKLYELNVEYRDHQNKMYLKYLSYVNYFKIFTGDEIAQIYQYREFFVNDIQNESVKAISKDEMINSDIPLHQQGVEHDPDFWNNYNMIMMEQPYKN